MTGKGLFFYRQQAVDTGTIITALSLEYTGKANIIDIDDGV